MISRQETNPAYSDDVPESARAKNTVDVLHVDVADIAVKILNDVSVNGSVERRQVAITASQLLQDRAISRVD